MRYESKCDRIDLEVNVTAHEGPETSNAALEQYLWDCLQVYDEINVNVEGLDDKE